MSIIVKPNTFSAGATIIASEHNANFDTIYSDYNGNITNSNISASAAIVDTKLAQLTTAQKVNTSTLVTTSQAIGDILYADTATSYARRATGGATTFLSGGTIPNYRAIFFESDIGKINFLTAGTGNLPLKHFAGGTSASTTTFWRGDRSWAAPTNVQIFTSDNNFTAPAGVTKVYLTMVGGGGGGGGSASSGRKAGGGGGGAQVINYQYTVIPGNVYVVDVGAGGAGGAAGDNNGVAGSATTFDATVSASGGALGSKGSVSTGGSGGGGINASTNTAGTYTIQGGNGAAGSGVAVGGGGGGTIAGAGGAGANDAGNGTSAAANTGGGGGGAGRDDTGNYSGGDGGSGICIVMY